MKEKAKTGKAHNVTLLNICVLKPALDRTVQINKCDVLMITLRSNYLHIDFHVIIFIHLAEGSTVHGLSTFADDAVLL